MSSSYWTPSRCAKILIDKAVQDLPADLFIYVKGAGCRLWGAEWWCVATPLPAPAAAPLADTTTSRCNCRQLSDPPNLTRLPPVQPSRTLHTIPLTTHSFLSAFILHV